MKRKNSYNETGPWPRWVIALLGIGILVSLLHWLWTLVMNLF